MSEMERTDFEIHRTKGRIQLVDGTLKLLQGVREVFELLDAADVSGNDKSPASQSRTGEGGKIVLIGRGIVTATFEHSLQDALQTG